MSRSRRPLGAAAILGAIIAASSSPAAAHAIGSTFTLPVPLWLYLWGAAAAVGASFVVAVLLVRSPSEPPRYPTLALPAGPSRVASVLLAVLGLAWWLGAIAGGLLLPDSAPLPAVLLWIGIWVGLPLSAVLLGDAWPSLSPFRTLYGGIEWLVRRFGRRADLGLSYPAQLARWPAVALLFVALWAELVLPGREAAGVVGRLLLGYTLLTLAGMVLFGRVAWLRHAEFFERLMGWFGHVGPIGRRSRSPELCEGCAEGCDPARCVDCPECAAAAEADERTPELRPHFSGLTEVRRGGWSDAGFIVLALAGVTFDGLQETSAWGTIVNAIQPPLVEAVGALNAVLLSGTIGLLGMWLAFMAIFAIAVAATRRLSGGTRAPLRSLAGAYAATLLPIAAGYLVAHYGTLVLQGIIWLPDLLRDPVRSVAPEVTVAAEAVWYLSVGAIVLGHVAAVVLAHRLALRDAPAHAIRAGLPLVLLMIGYTILSLWIIGQPIVLEPGTVPPGG
ncbi:MAG: hypothetical protein ABI534_05365 [Chloroflexota bacterium]